MAKWPRIENHAGLVDGAGSALERDDLQAAATQDVEVPGELACMIARYAAQSARVKHARRECEMGEKVG